MEFSSPYEQETKDVTRKSDAVTSQELVPYAKPLQAGQVDPYILEIRRRLQEDVHARREREKRRRKVLVDQLRALEAIEVNRFSSSNPNSRLSLYRIPNAKNLWSAIYSANLNSNGDWLLNYFKHDTKKISFARIALPTKNNWRFGADKTSSKRWIAKR